MSISLYQQRWGKALRSSSAEKVAMLRAFAHNERDPSVRNPDYLAGEFAGSGPINRSALALSKVTPVRTSVRWLGDVVIGGGYWLEVARVKHYDEVLLAEVGKGVRQVIVLGAGLDSRAYRFADRLEGVRFFEVDHPATSSYKRERVEATFGSTPPHVSYIAHDLTESSVEEALADSGFDPAAPVLVLWIGVTMYLPPAAVDKVLRWAGGLAEGSSLGFDCLEQDFFEEKGKLSRERRARFFFELSGERFLCGFEDSSLADQLGEKGLELVSHLDPQEAEERYLRRSNGRTAGPIFPYWRYLHARTAGFFHL